ncbi:hypothetical protein E2320_000998, partial [Naja naja]
VSDTRVLVKDSLSARVDDNQEFALRITTIGKLSGVLSISIIACVLASKNPSVLLTLVSAKMHSLVLRYDRVVPSVLPWPPVKSSTQFPLQIICSNFWKKATCSFPGNLLREERREVAV